MGTLRQQPQAWALYLQKRRRRRLVVPTPPPPPILIPAPGAFWRLEEVSGTRFDSVGSADWTANNNPGSIAGKLGTAADVDAGSVQYLSQPERAELLTPAGSSMTCALWFYPRADELGTLLWKDGGQFSLGQSYIGAGGIYFDMWMESVNGTEYEWSANVGGGTYEVGKWNFVCFQFDYANQQIRVGVKAEDAPGGVTMGTYTIQNPPVNFSPANGQDWLLGHYAVNLLNSPVDSVAYWPATLLSPSEIDDLFNAGAGREYYAGAWH